MMGLRYLSKKDLLDLAEDYHKYILKYIDDIKKHDWEPVSMATFYLNFYVRK